MVGTRRRLGILPRSVAVGRLCRVLGRLISTKCRWRKVAQGLHRILGAPTEAHPGEKQFWGRSQRCRTALDGTALDFSAHRKCLPECDLSEVRLRLPNAAFDDLRQ